MSRALMTTTSLAERLATGDEGAIDDLVARFQRPVWAIAQGVLGDPRLAEDAAQETFIKVWRNRHRFDPGRPLDPWVYQIARNAARDVARRSRRHTRHEVAAATTADDTRTAADVADASMAPDVLLEQALLRGFVRSALDQLAPHDRDVLRLRHLDGLSDREIAERLAIPTGTVKSRAHRARARLLELVTT